jgi:hypothetical protein
MLAKVGKKISIKASLIFSKRVIYRQIYIRERDTCVLLTGDLLESLVQQL